MNTPHAHLDFESLPPLRRDPAYWGMTVTQFLGALNDTVFKQLVLLLCLGVAVSPGAEPKDKQFVANAIFALSFILFSGIAGFWSDRVTKRTLIIGCKVLEIVVMLAALGTFAWMAAPTVVEQIREIDGAAAKDTVFLTYGTPWLLFGVLFLMGTQSAIFGPAKYGILPEMVRGADLPRFNGAIQMTTFVALIIGVWIGGLLLDSLHHSLWLASLVCVGIAVIGTATSFLVRRTPIAQRDAPFHLAALAADTDTIKLLKQDAPLRRALLAYSLFWFVAAILPMGINWLGKFQFRLSYADTSLLLATSSLGIAAGFILGGYLSKGMVRFGLMRLGAWGLFVCLILMALPRSFTPDIVEIKTTIGQAAGADADPASLEAKIESETQFQHLLGYRGSQVILVFMGFFAGLFALPVQVFLQSRPPESLKGRMIGTMNLINWIAIILSALFYMACETVLANIGAPKFALFGLTAIVMLPLAICYRPADVRL